MVALPIERQQSDSGGWQSIRQQLFGEQRQRQAEDGLIAILTQLHTRLAAATRDSKGGAPRNPQGRAAALRAILEGANGLLTWHGEQCQAATTGGWWTLGEADTAAQILAAAAREYPLFEAADVRRGAIDCTDVIDSIGQLRGAESAGFYNDVLDGLTAVLGAIYDRLRLDDPTAGAAGALEGTWRELAAELDALACPGEMVAPVPEMPALAPSPEAPAAVVEPAPPAAPKSGKSTRKASAKPQPVAETPRLALQILRFADGETETPASDLEHPVVSAIAPVASNDFSSIAARFYRFQLVAC